MRLSEACERYRDEIVRYLAKHFGIGDRAEDAAQHAFSQAALKLPHIREMPQEAVRAWLYAAARNAAIDALRKDRRLLYGHDFSRSEEGERTMDEADRLAIREAVEGLDALKQQLVHMRYDQGLNSSEIAAATGMNASTIRYHLMTAARQLRQQLKEEEG